MKNIFNFTIFFFFAGFLLIIDIMGTTIVEDNSIYNKFLDLDFELFSPGVWPSNWSCLTTGYEVLLDSVNYYSGKRSLKITKISQGNFGTVVSTFPVEESKGKRVSFTGYIKTQNVENGYAGLWWRVDGTNKKLLGFDNMNNRGPSGTTTWKKYTIEMEIDKDAKNIAFGAILIGDGSAWFDELKIEINGHEYKQEIFVPNNEQLSWVKKNALQFNSSDIDKNFEKIDILNRILGNSRIISLGEGTHGTSEFFRTKDHLVRYVAKNHGNVVFGIEANMPEAKKVNDYIQSVKGNAKDALAGMYFWTWNTQEVLDMIEWMKDYNLSGKGNIEFWGFDLQTPTVAVENVKNFIKEYDPGYYDSLNYYYDEVLESFKDFYLDSLNITGKALKWYISSENVLNHLYARKKYYLKLSDSLNVEWIIQNAKIINQGAEMHLPNKKSRDENMALNVEWIVNYTKSKNSKYILWAHNEHVSAANDGMGKYLKLKYGKDIINIGFAFFSGTYTAIGDTGLGIYSTLDPVPGSLEWSLHKTGINKMFLDLRQVSKSEQAKWLNKKLDFRVIGAQAMAYAFYPTIITNAFDVLIYFEQSTPTHSFGRLNNIN